MSSVKNLNELTTEICQRLKQNGKELNITDVKRVLRHAADCMAEEWARNHNLDISAFLRRNGMGRIKRKPYQ